ncbi:MAG: hypothetical protein GY765_05500 [bacterium]|nr:hypothetical protein [bacterium]
MAKQTPKKGRSIAIKIAWILAGTALLFLVIHACFSHWGPGFTESFIKTKAKELGLVSPRLKVRDVGLNKIGITGLQVGDKNGFSVSFLSLDYTPAEMRNGKIKKIAASGALLKIERSPKGWVLKGLQPLMEATSGESPQVVAENIEIRHSVIQLSLNGQSLALPIQLQARYSAEKQSYFFSASIQPLGAVIQLKGDINPYTGTGTFEITGNNIRLEHFPGEILPAAELFFKSRIALQATVHIKQWDTLQASVKLQANDFKVRFPGGIVDCALDLGFSFSTASALQDIALTAAIKEFSYPAYKLGTSAPFTFVLKGPRLQELEFSFSPFTPLRQRELRVEALSGTIHGVPQKPVVKGLYELRIPASRSGEAGFIPKGAPIGFLARLLPGLQSPFPLSLAGGFSVSPAGGDEPLTWELKGKGSCRKLLFDRGIRALCNQLFLDLTLSGRGGDLKSFKKVTLKGIEITHGDNTFRADQIRMSTRLKLSEKNGFSGSGRIKLKAGQINGPDGLQSGEITADLPWGYTSSGNGRIREGTIDIQSLAVSGFTLGRIRGKIRQSNRTLQLSGEILTAVEQLRLKLSGAASYTKNGGGLKYSVAFSMPTATLPIDTDLALLHPMFQGMTLSGELYAGGIIAYNPNADKVFQSEGQLKAKNIALVLVGEEDNITVNGVNTDIRFTDLMEMVSQKKQVLRFSDIDMHGFKVTDGSFVFNIESPDSIFIEKGEGRIFLGKVMTRSFRYQPGKGDISTALYCDRLDFDRLINRLMEQEIAFGDAELNGLIPVEVSGGTFKIADGYLYSTPGIKGNIKFTDSSMISGGVLLVEEAVKDFNYDWIKVQMDSDGERLNVTLFLDGVPADKLPLTLNSKTKDIVRDKKGRKTLNLKGLLLELRLWDIDLKSLLKTGSKIIFSGEKGK